jgi:hypothetical protein
MTERLLQYLWQFQYFNKQSLVLDNGDELRIVHPGRFNANQGPDFLEAKIKIETTLWVGHVELHLKTSDWFKHAHQLDRNYDNVVLHVVWEHDLPDHGLKIPVFSLQSRVPRLLLQQYESWMNSPSFIACGQQARYVRHIIWAAWKERLSIERLQRKTTAIFSYLQQNNQHWEETFWWLLARNFGTTVNAEPFEAAAKTLPVTLLARHKNQLNQLEALLMGQCGLLEGDFSDDYPIMLQKEYRYLRKKYNLQPVRQPVHFLRMRPMNFPTVRLAQLAALIQQSGHLFAHIKETESIEDIKKLFSVTANDFWHYHYTFTDISDYQPKKPGRQMVHTIIINTVVPLLFAYGVMHNEEQLKNRALHWLESMPAERNYITSGFTGLGISNRHANHSQALIELKSHYCDHKKCLDCSVGNALLKMQLKDSHGPFAALR